MSLPFEGFQLHGAGGDVGLGPGTGLRFPSSGRYRASLPHVVVFPDPRTPPASPGTAACGRGSLLRRAHHPGHLFVDDLDEVLVGEREVHSAPSAFDLTAATKSFTTSARRRASSSARRTSFSAPSTSPRRCAATFEDALERFRQVLEYALRSSVAFKRAYEYMGFCERKESPRGLPRGLLVCLPLPAQQRVVYAGDPAQTSSGVFPVCVPGRSRR